MKNFIFILLFGLVVFLVFKFPYTMINPGELSSGHQKLKNECNSCHQPFVGIANEKCLSCHKIAEIGKAEDGKQHKALFHQNLSSQKCSACHSEHQGLFPEKSLSGFKHELLAASIISDCKSCHNMPNNNLHKQVSTNCNSCHQTQNWKSSITFNHEMLLNKSNCTNCHQKPDDSYHNSINTNCDNCHNTNKWKPSTFNHSAYFILDQKHTTDCNTCHKNSNFTSYTCYGCHEHNANNIQAEHNEEGIYNISNCVSCHKSGSEHGEKNNNNGEKDDD